MKRHFRLATTSFIYPDHILPNVKKLGPYFDEIELLVFESLPGEVLPSPAQIQELALLSKDLDLTYNVHLPTDVSLTGESARDRQAAADTIARVVELFEPAGPTTHTLHLEMDNSQAAGPKDAWQEKALDGLGRLIPNLPGAGILSVETLDYPPPYLVPILEAWPVQVCIDAGHHFKYGFDLAQSFGLFRDRVPLVHFHGVSAGPGGVKDHLGLDCLDPGRFDLAVDLFRAYTGTLCLEVFGLDKLNRSLGRLAAVFSDIPGRLSL